MEDVIRVQDRFYILATAAKATERTAVLKQDDTFAIFDYSGDIAAFGDGEQGLYHEDTRYVSRLRLRLSGQRPLLLSARVKEDNELFGADLTNPDIPLGDTDQVLTRDLVHLFRARFLWNGTCHERIRLCNYSRANVHVSLTLEIETDFADIFEVRGTTRDKRGTLLGQQGGGRELRFGYRGLDGEERWTTFEWSDPPAMVGKGVVRWDYDLTPQAPWTLSMAIHCERARKPRRRLPSFDAAQARAAAALEEARRKQVVIDTSSERFNRWLRRSSADLRMLLSNTPHGTYPYAGVPWFSTPFGRDGLITGLQTLWVEPGIARGVLEYLAATQADEVDERRDAEPGKILHETRSGEMAALGEVPFGRYYGSVDATPLFVMLAGAYFERTTDLDFLERLWPHVERALAWIDRHGDRDGDGFVEYARQSSSGLVHQGWKDSQDSIFHADGTLAEGPIAVAEVQAYAFDARTRAARMAEALGDAARCTLLREQAERLRVAFEREFWCEEESTYALALDGRKRPCRVRSSNAGHCLFGGIASTDRARRVAQLLAGPDMFSGWGIRTLASVERRYNPMSYHNGSVWPHDNGLIAAGFSRYGLDEYLMAPVAGLFEASGEMDLQRLPELFCGFHRRPGESPTNYPVACAPQAWASGVAFHLVHSCLRMALDDSGARLTVTRPVLPPFLTYVRLLGLELPAGRMDLLFEQQPGGVHVTVLQRTGRTELQVIT